MVVHMYIILLDSRPFQPHDTITNDTYLYSLNIVYYLVLSENKIILYCFYAYSQK